MAAASTAAPEASVAVDPYVIDTLLPDLVGHDRKPGAFLVYLFLWRHSSRGEEVVSVSLREIAEGTGISKRSVQDALRRLVQRQLVSVRREGITAIGQYRVGRPWIRGRTSDERAETAR